MANFLIENTDQSKSAMSKPSELPILEKLHVQNGVAEISVSNLTPETIVATLDKVSTT